MRHPRLSKSGAKLCQPFLQLVNDPLAQGDETPQKKHDRNVSRLTAHKTIDTTQHVGRNCSNDSVQNSAHPTDMPTAHHSHWITRFVIAHAMQTFPRLKISALVSRRAPGDRSGGQGVSCGRTHKFCAKPFRNGDQ